MGMTGFELASVGLAGANLVSGFGSGSRQHRRNKSLMRKSYKYATQYEPGLIKARMRGAVEGAKEAGLHPLFALGGGAMSGGGPSVAPAGQSETGGAQTDAVMGLVQTLLDIQGKRESSDQARQQAMNSAMRVIEHKMNSDNLASDTLMELARQKKALNPMQEYKPGEVQAHRKDRTEQSQNKRRVWHMYEYGPHKVWLPIEEISELLENPVKIFGMAQTYHGNAGVDWAGVWHYHRKGTMKGYRTPKQHYRENVKHFRERKTERKFGERFKRENKRIQLLRHRGG